MHTGTYGVKNTKGLIPQELLELILKNNTSGMGVASARIDGFVQSGVGKPVLEELTAFQEQYKDHTILFHFFESVEDMKAEDIQPFIILKDDADKPLLAAFLEGPFDRHKDDGGHTPEYNAAFEYLKDRVEGLYAIARGDMAKFMELMKAAKFKKEVVNVVGEGNSITLLSSSGELVSYGEAEKLEKQPWGWFTNTYGYGKAAEQVKVAEKPKGMAALFAGKKPVEQKVNNPPAQTLQAVAAKPEEKTDKGPGLQEAATVLHNQTAATNMSEKIWVIPTRKVQWSNNKKSAFYHAVQPSMARDAWKNTPPVETTRADLEKLKIKDYDIVDAPKKEKDVATHNTPPVTAATPTDKVAKSEPSLVSVIPRAPADECKRVVAIVQGSKGTIDPEQFKEMERKNPTILDIAGLKHWDQLHKLDFNDIYEIAANRSASAIMIMNLIGQHMRLSEKEKSVQEAAQKKIAM